MGKPDKHFYEFDCFCVDARKRRLLRSGEVVPLVPKAFDTLLALVASGGRVMEKDELMQAVWAGTVVEESALARNIYLLRKALGESPDDHRYIVTVPGRGYRFVAEVIESPDEPPELIVATRTRTRVVTEEESDAATGGSGDAAKEAEAAEFSSVAESPPRPLAASPHRRIAVSPIRRVSPSFLAAGALLLLALPLGYWAWRKVWTRGAGAPVTSLAVLPFKPVVAAGGDEYLQMGLADVLINRLSNIKQLTVRPTSAVRKYAGPEQDAVAAGRELQVEAVLDGNIQRAGDRVRVTARLARTSDGATLWAATFDEKFTDLLSVEDKLAERLAAALAVKLTGEERERLARRATASAAAFEAYLKGRFFWGKWSRDGLQRAVTHFEQAIKLDPHYAPAHSGLADTYNLLGYLNFMPPREAFPKSEAAALQALRLDDSLGEAHLSLAKVKFFYHWDAPGFERELQRALDLNPHDADAHGMRGTYLTAIGKFDEAVAARQRALELDPLSPLYTNMVGWPYFYARRYDEAIAWYKRALELDPHFIQAHADLGLCYRLLGKNDEAIAAILQARTLSDAKPETVAALRQAYAAGGMKGYWEKEKELAEAQMKQGRVRAWRMAHIYHALGDREQTFVWLEKAYEERDGLMPFLGVMPQDADLHSDPRFADLVRRIGLAR
jgi:DNA-binding winged helix-turn-helix (wHTH) protein/TolB-like protein/TPR repeat protein